MQNYNRTLIVILVLLFGCQPNQEIDSSKSSTINPLEIKSSPFTDSVFTNGIEGPSVDNDGNIYLVNYKEEGTIGKVDTNGHVELFLKIPEGGIANGTRFLNDSILYTVDYIKHRLLSINVKTKDVQVLAENDSMNQPNDLTISKSGVVYMSDPNWKDSTGNIWKYFNGHLSLAKSDLGTTNGIELDEDDLYVNESLQKRLVRYKVQKDSTLKEQSIETWETGGFDGMRFNNKGFLFIARYDAGHVLVLDKEGKELAKIVTMGAKPTNVCFSPDERYIYITMQDKIWIERANISNIQVQ